MSVDLDKRLTALIAADPDEADMTLMYELVDMLEQDPTPFRFVESIVRFMEAHPQVHFGAPGPLVHFVEKFYRQGYEPLLCESFRRRPTGHTAFMLNRIINDTSGAEKCSYVALLTDALARKDLDQCTLEAIGRFLNYT